MFLAHRNSIAALLVLTMFSTVMGQFVDCGTSCSSQGCCITTAAAAKPCCGGCESGAGCQCRKSRMDAPKSCCSQPPATATRSCCTPKSSSACTTKSSTTKIVGCGTNCTCVQNSEFPPIPLEQQSKLADSLKLPVMNLGPVLAVLPAAHELSSGYFLLDDSPPPRAGQALRIWICSWTN
jgi:hypothetical protein